MQITITGPRGGGSTTLAIEVAKFLQSRGQRVVFKSRTPENESRLRERAAKASESLEMTSGAKVIIVEGMEEEDEKGIALR